MIEADFDGHETFWAVADNTMADALTVDVVEEFFPNAELRTEFTGHEGLVDFPKVADLLGWNPSTVGETSKSGISLPSPSTTPAPSS